MEFVRPPDMEDMKKLQSLQIISENEENTLAMHSWRERERGGGGMMRGRVEGQTKRERVVSSG